MKLITQDGASAFAAMVDTMAIDPASWQKWCVLHMTIEMPLGTAMDASGHIYAIHDINHHLNKVDGMAYLCEDMHLFVMCRNISDSDVSSIGRDISTILKRHFELRSEMALYHPAENWRGLRDICVQHGYVGACEYAGDEEEGANPLSLVAQEMEEVFFLNNKHRMKTAAQPPKIMLVEDDPLARRIVSTCLKDSQHLITATSAEEAVTNYMLHIPDIVFLDIGLPDHDGFSVMDAIKTHNPDAYIVMFSGKGYADYIAKSLQMGASGFVEKPFRKENLFHYIDDFTEQRVN